MIKANESVGLHTKDHDNCIMSPDDIADIILLKEKSEFILPESAEYLELDMMLSFEIGDLSSFLIMKPHSSNLNTIYNFGGKKLKIVLRSLYITYTINFLYIT